MAIVNWALIMWQALSAWGVGGTGGLFIFIRSKQYAQSNALSSCQTPKTQLFWPPSEVSSGWSLNQTWKYLLSLDDLRHRVLSGKGSHHAFYPGTPTQPFQRRSKESYSVCFLQTPNLFGDVGNTLDSPAGGPVWGQKWPPAPPEMALGLLI